MKHIQQHFSGSDTVLDMVIGMADGLTVPFASAAGNSGALNFTRIPQRRHHRSFVCRWRAGAARTLHANA